MISDNGFARSFKVAVEHGLDFEQLHGNLQAGVDAMLRHPKYRDGAHIWMTGSGDSLFAAQAAIPGLERWAKLNATALSSMEFARYRSPLLTERDMVWAISNSGSAARTRETVGLAREKQVLSVGLTGSATGPLAAAADVLLLRQVGELTEIDPHSRGIFLNMVEFLAALYSVYYAGLQLGVAGGALTATAADHLLKDCRAAILAIGEVAGAIEEQTRILAAEVAALDTIWILGAGPSFATARYCAAKFHEQLPWNGIPEDMEEWAHLQYFLTLAWKERSVVIVLAPPGNSLDRAEELVQGIHEVGGRAIVVAHPAHGRFPSAHCILRIACPESEFLCPFTYHLPAQMLILYLARLRGEEPFALRRADGYKLIRHGVVLTSGEGLR